jgi:hypothetical protein
MRKGAVWMSEDLEGGHLLGTFSGVHDTGGARPRDAFSDLPIEDALAWARARADYVCVEIVYTRYSAGAKPLSDYPEWPPHDLPALVRRRPPGEEWRDRTDDDAPIAWAVVAWVERADCSVPERADWDGAVAALAAQAGADSWDTEELDASIAAMERALRRAKPGEAAGWVSWGHAAYRLRFTVKAPTRARALEAIRRRCVPPDGLTLTLEAEPSARSAD